MLDIKFIRQNPDLIKEFLQKRNFSFDIEALLELDKKRRAKIVESEEVVAQRNKYAKEIGHLKAKGEDSSHLLKQVAASKDQEEQLVQEAKMLEQQLEDMLSYVPNILLPEVPAGTDENHNLEVKKVGTPKTFSFKAKDHTQIGENLGMMDFEAAAQMSGSRFVILKDDLSFLERALANFMLDMHKNKGYVEYSVPTLVKQQALFNTSQLPKFKEDLFLTTDNKYLIPTTEVPLTNLVANQHLKSEQLPLRFTGLSLCYRSEAGAAGKDTKGMIRQHQFYKVELVSIAHPDNSAEELEFMLSCAEDILQQLNLPYRVMLLCSGDIGFSAAKTYDIEVWLPGQNTYREISSCSNCLDFQARRMNTKVKTNKGNVLVNTLNGSGLAVGRTLVAVLENYQQEDGSVIVPEVLMPYMNGKKIITQRNC